MKCLVLVLTLALSSSAFAAAVHPIDKVLGDCIKKNSTTSGMNKCSSEAYASWDKELNVIYGKLQKALKTTAAKTALVNAQRDWMKFRDESFSLQSAVYDEARKNAGGGTMFSNMGSGDKLAVVKSRVLELQSLLSTLEGF